MWSTSGSDVALLAFLWPIQNECEPKVAHMCNRKYGPIMAFLGKAALLMAMCNLGVTLKWPMWKKVNMAKYHKIKCGPPLEKNVAQSKGKHELLKAHRMHHPKNGPVSL